MKTAILAESNEVIKCLKACILSRKGGIPFCELNDDYKELVGTDVPVKDLGFSSLSDLLCGVEGLFVDSRLGLVKTIPSEKTKHLHELISKQKDKPKKASKRYLPYKNPRHQETYRPQPQRQYNPKHIQAYNKTSRYITYQKNDYSHRKTYYEKPKNSSYDYSHSKYYNYDDGYSSCREDSFKIYDEEYYSDGSTEFYDNEYAYEVNKYSFYGHKVKSFKREATLIYNQQVIGDDLMLSILAPSSLCAAGLTVKRAILMVRQFGCARRIVVALGTIDILKGLSGSELILDMSELIQTVLNTGATVTVCTIPPVASVRSDLEAIDAINTFNDWLVYGDHRADDVVDLNRPFKKGRFVNYSLFDKHPQMMVYPDGCRRPLFMWNRAGQDVVLKRLKLCFGKIED